MKSKNRARWVMRIAIENGELKIVLQKVKANFVLAEIPIANFYELHKYRSWKWIPPLNKIPVIA